MQFKRALFCPSIELLEEPTKMYKTYTYALIKHIKHVYLYLLLKKKYAFTDYYYYLGKLHKLNTFGKVFIQIKLNPIYLFWLDPWSKVFTLPHPLLHSWYNRNIYIHTLMYQSVISSLFIETLFVPPWCHQSLFILMISKSNWVVFSLKHYFFLFDTIRVCMYIYTYFDGITQ